MQVEHTNECWMNGWMDEKRDGKAKSATAVGIDDCLCVFETLFLNLEKATTWWANLAKKLNSSVTLAMAKETKGRRWERN